MEERGEVDAPTAKSSAPLPPPQTVRRPKLPPPPLDVSVSDSEMPEVENDSSGDGNRQSKTVENADDNIEPENDEEDTIEYIVERRICDDGYIEYKVHWANTTEDQDEWFPRDDLVVEYPRQVEIFEANADRTALPKSVTLPPDLPSPASMDGKARSNDLGLAEIEELENEIQEKSMRIRDLEDDVFKYKRQLKRAKRDVDDLNKRLSNYKADLQKQDEVHENMSYQISSLKSQLENAERKIATSNSPNSSMAPPPPPPDSNSIKQEQEANQKVLEDLNNANREIKELKEICEKKEREKEGLVEELNEAKKAIDRYKIQLEEEIQKTAEHRKLLLECKTKLAQQAQNESDSKELPQEVQEELERLREKASTDEGVINKLKSELRTKTENGRRQDEQFSIMRELLAQAKAELKTRAAEVLELKNTIETDRKAFEKNMDIAEKERAVQMEERIQSRLAAARKVAETEIEGIKNELRRTETRLVEEMKQRRKLHNEIMELKGNIRVYCRSRPVNKTELNAGEKCSKVVLAMPDKDEGTIVVNAALENRQVHSRFDFDSSFNANTSQEEVFRKVQPFVISKYSFDSIGAGSVSNNLPQYTYNVHLFFVVHRCYGWL